MSKQTDLVNISQIGPLSNRNMIINGGMQVDQRNSGAAVTVGGSPVFVADRFHSQNTTTTGTITGQQSTLGNSSSFKLIATSAVTNLTTAKYVYGLIAVLEAQDVYHLNGNTVTLSFTVETNWAGNLPIAVRSFNSTRSYVADVTVVSGVNNVAVSIPLEAGTVDAIDNGVGLTLTIGFNNEATYQTATTGAWVAGNKLTSTSSTQWAKTTGNFINITNLQLEAGDTATPFEHRSFGDELARCRRYFYNLKYTAYYQPVKAPCWIITTTVMQGEFMHPVTMRTGPTLGNNGVGNFRVNDNIGGDQVCNSIALGVTTENHTLINFGKATANLSVGNCGYINTEVNNDAEFTFDAEL